MHPVFTLTLPAEMLTSLPNRSQADLTVPVNDRLAVVLESEFQNAHTFSPSGFFQWHRYMLPLFVRTGLVEPEGSIVVRVW